MTGPYGAAALDYFQAGWTGVLPVKGKSVPPTGYTGATGVDTSYADVHTWLGEPEMAGLNIGLRPPPSVVGLDVDAYAGRNGGRSLATLEARWGALPPTVYSTSRTDGSGSGIRLYRVDGAEALAWPANLDGHVGGGPSHLDVIRRGHRYVMAWPSVHPLTGEVYRWHDADGAPLDGVPKPDDLPPLPPEWVAGLTGGQVADEPARRGLLAVEDERPRKHAGPIPEGTRHAALVGYAGYLRRVGLPLAEAEILMLRRLEDCAQPPVARTPVTKAEALAKVHDVYGRYPAGRVVPEEEAAEPDEASGRGPRASWAGLDLSAVLDGTYAPLEPTLLPRTDGQCLLYPGLVHGLHGESESGKSLLAQAEAARCLTAGLFVVYVDYESNASTVVGRLLLMGVAPEAIRSRLVYVRPERSPADAAERDAWTALLAQPAALVVIDGVTEALTTMGRSTVDNDEVTLWFRQVPRAIAQATGAAVVLVDHVTKSTEGRGRFAIGAQAKMSALDGASYAVEVVQPLGRGMRGVLRLWVGKDREGGVRPHCGRFRPADRAQLAATVVVDSTAGPITVEVQPPDDLQGTPARPFRPTGFMERLSRALEGSTEPLPGNALVRRSDLVAGKAEHKAKALDLLVAEGYVTRTRSGQAQMHTSVRPYREAEDTDSPSGVGSAASTPLDQPTPTPSLGVGSRESVPTALQPLPGVGRESVGVGGARALQGHPVEPVEPVSDDEDPPW